MRDGLESVDPSGGGPRRSERDLRRLMVGLGVPALALAWGCSDGGGSGNGRAGDGGVDLDATAGLDAGGDGGTGEDGGSPPQARWAQGSLGSDPVVGFAAQGETTWMLTAGAVHALRDGQVQTEALPELAWPVAMHGRDGTVAAVGFDAEGNSWVAVHEGTGWRTADLPGEPCPAGPDCVGVVGARAPGRVDVGTDGVVRIPSFGVITGLREEDGELVPYEEVTFSGNDELRFHTLRSFGADGSWMFSGDLAMHSADLGSWTAFRQFGGTLVAADAHSGAATFVALGTELLHFGTDDLTVFHRVATPESYRLLSARSDSFALAAGAAGRLAVVGPLLGRDPNDFLAAGGLGLRPVDLGSTTDLTAVFVGPDDAVWVGGADGTVWHFGLDAPAEWSDVAADPVRFEDPTDPEPMDGGVPPPDQGVLPDEGVPPVGNAVARFVGLASTGGTYACDGRNALGPAVGVWPGLSVAFGDVDLAPGRHDLEEELSAAGMCRGLGLDEFTINAQAGGEYTVVLGLGLSFSAQVLTDDSSAGPAGTARYRIFGVNRRGTDRLQNVEYCVDGAPLPGGDAPRTAYTERPAGPLPLEVRGVANPPCSGPVEFSVAFTLEPGSARTFFLAPGTDTGPVKPEPDLLAVICLDGQDGVRPARANCADLYVPRR